VIIALFAFLGTAFIRLACFVNFQRPMPRDHAPTDLVKTPPVNVSVIVDSSPSDALIGVCDSR
jgi:hypothetical protein